VAVRGGAGAHAGVPHRAGEGAAAAGTLGSPWRHLAARDWLDRWRIWWGLAD
jgi:hypothetical protein